MRIRVLTVLVAAIAAIALLAGCGKQDIGGYEGLGEGQIYSFQEPYPGKARVVGPNHVVLYAELPSEATDIEVSIEKSHYGIFPFVTFTDKEGVRRMRVFNNNIKVYTEQGVYEIKLWTIREVNACAGQCPNYD